MRQRYLMSTREKTPVHLNNDSDWKAVGLIALICVAALAGIIVITHVGMKLAGMPTSASVRQNNWLNHLPVAKIQFIGPRGDELEARTNAMLNASRTQVPTGSVILTGNLMWLRSKSGKTPYGVAIQFQDGTGYYRDCPIAMKSGHQYMDYIAEGLLNFLLLDRSTR